MIHKDFLFLFFFVCFQVGTNWTFSNSPTDLQTTNTMAWSVWEVWLSPALKMNWKLFSQMEPKCLPFSGFSGTTPLNEESTAFSSEIRIKASDFLLAKWIRTVLSSEINTGALVVIGS